jgi:hypothetical protein
MKIHKIAVPALALLLSAAGLGIGATHAAAQQYGWDAPPRELNEFQQRGFHDGIEGARKDFENHRQPNVENRDEFRHPGVPPNVREAYQDGFRRGYQVGVSHFYNAQPAPPVYNAPPPPPPPVAGGWRGIWENRAFNDLERRGFEDGRIGAQKDVENHRRPDPNNRDEYRDPHLPPDAAEQYRAGFRRGYEEQIAQIYGIPQNAQWDYVPDRFSEVSQRGFHDGVDGARRDVENHRRPDPNNRDEYRNPHVPPQLVDDYREGFRLGYERAIAHFFNGTPGY